MDVTNDTQWNQFIIELNELIDIIGCLVKKLKES